jgi:hypothetical protein
MHVWVNSTGGWVEHGTMRVSADRAEWVARLLERRLGWETTSGSAPPPPRSPRAGAPSRTIAATSPAKFPRRRIGG